AARRPGSGRHPRARPDPAHDGPERPGATREVPGARDPGVAVQPGDQVRRRRGPARPGDGWGRPRADPRRPARIAHPAGAAPPALSRVRPDPPIVSSTSIASHMASPGKILIETITSIEPGLRDRSARALIAGASLAEKIQACEELEQFRQRSDN